MALCHLTAVLYGQDEWRYLLAGGTSRPKELPNPAPGWLSERSWGDILTLAALNKYSEFAVDFSNHLDKFKEIFDSIEPHRFVVLFSAAAAATVTADTSTATTTTSAYHYYRVTQHVFHFEPFRT